ncbi:MAG: cbb3-type cytochrome c oxidase N-terminal domain-containing protein [Planctomycetota bacterium]
MADQQPTPDEHEELLTSHNYDGIQEYDNPTPRWWDLMFVGTAVFAVVYGVWFHAPTMGRTLDARYEASLAANMRLQFGEIGELEANEATVVKYMGDPDWLKVGAATFATHCVSCHGTDGSGISGPNLTDDHYKNVKQIVDIATVVRDGAAKGAMPAWGNRLHPNEVVLVASYVASMRGQNLPSDRPAEGQIIAPWPVAEAAPDSPTAPEKEQSAAVAATLRDSAT